MPKVRVGNRAFRTRGTSAGFRVRSDSEVVGVKEFIQVRNAEGQVSNWLPADDFDCYSRVGRREVAYWLVMWRDRPGGVIQKQMCESPLLAQSTIAGVRNNGYILVATKKITLEIDQ